MLINPAITSYPTFGSILQLCQSMTEETPGSDNARAAAEWHPWITTAADDVAKMSDCHWATDIINLVADQTDYCPPRVYRIKAMRALNGTTWQPLGLTTRGRAQPLYGANYINTNASFPYEAIVGAAADDGGTFRIFPACSIDVTGGLEIEGFAALGRTWAYDANGVAQEMTAATLSPLPEWATMAIVARAIWYRCFQKLMTPGYGERLAVADKLFNEQMWDVRSKAAAWYRETYSRRQNGYGWFA